MDNITPDELKQISRIVSDSRITETDRKRMKDAINKRDWVLCGFLLDEFGWTPGLIKKYLAWVNANDNG